jgi:hypothetical protein
MLRLLRTAMGHKRLSAAGEIRSASPLGAAITNAGLMSQKGQYLTNAFAE